MGLIISVYRNAEFGCCCNGGITSTNTSLHVVNADGPVAASSRPVVMIVDDFPNNKSYPKIVPAVWNSESETWEPEKGQFMFGGNYAGCSDSRFGRSVEKITGNPQRILPVHDRVEG